MADLSVLIPARNEMFLGLTIKDILANSRGDTEIIVVCDGSWPQEPLETHPKVSLIHHPVSIGQRAAVNEAARLSTAKYIMKLDAHCALDEGFDLKLMADCSPDWTVIPRMYNLHVFDWQCQACGKQSYQGPRPGKCEECGAGEFERVIVWKPRLNRKTDFARFDNTLHFQYWGAYGKRPEAQGDIADVMCSVGAGWFMERRRFWELGGLDEAHGSWGQMGVEIACKSWLSGGRQVVNKKTWFAHLFRTQPGFGFPYPNPGIEKARERSRYLWLGDNWPGAIRPLSWLLEKYWPIPDWNEADLDSLKKVKPVKRAAKKGIVYYTDNRLDSKLMATVQEQLTRCANGHELVSVSLSPIAFGRNISLAAERGILTMFRQILAGLKASTADIVFLCEHDVIYHPSHFDFSPPSGEVYYYNENTWKIDARSGQALFYYCRQTSGLCAYRDLLIHHYEERVRRVEAEGFSRRMGFEPGTHNRKERVDNYPSEGWMSAYPNLDIRHNHNLTPSRWRQEEFRNKRYCQGWTMAGSVPGWGQIKGRFEAFLEEITG